MRVTLTILMVILITLTSTSILQVHASEAPHIFTWVSHDVNTSTAETLQQLGFTDVVVRYAANLSLSNQTLSEYGLRLWQWIGPWTGKDLIENSTSNPYPLAVDDCHAMLRDLSREEGEKFFNAVRNYGSDVVLVFYVKETEIAETYNLSGIDVDIYGLPYYMTRYNYTNIQMNARSVGVYLWVWDGWELNWTNITHKEIHSVYELAQNISASRFTVWMGSETDTVEKGMVQSSFLNYPEWFPTLTESNKQLMKGMAVLPEFTCSPLIISAVFLIASFAVAKTLKKHN